MANKTSKRKRTASTAKSKPAASAPQTQALEVVASGNEAPVEVPPAPAMSICLSSNCTLKEAAALQESLLQRLDEPTDVTIDVACVERIDTAIVQLLCAFVRDRAQRGLAVAWSSTPPSVLDAARLLGVGSIMSLPQESAS